MPMVAGTRLKTYEIVGPLGAGGMGEVYRAKDLRLGREVALKVLPDSLARDAEHLARFEREARTVAALNHPNIVTLFSVEDAGEVRFLTMELVDGQSLADLVRPSGMPVARALDMAIPIADALAAAHERGVVHRDLKPANVMVTREGRIKVLDFGLAKFALGTGPDSTSAGALSMSGMLVGTAPYMAPEQIRGEPADARSDLFAFGIVLYELLAGRRPFAGANAMILGAAILNETPDSLARVRSDVPTNLERLVNRCLEKEPRERAQSAQDVGNELRRLSKSLKDGRRQAPVASDIPSIAVLPFSNMSADPENEFFSDGLSEELLNVLAKIPELKVTGRTSSFAFKGKHEIAKEGSAGYREYALAIACHALGMRRESDEALARTIAEGEQWGYQVAAVHASRGEVDEAFHWLERSYELHDSGIVLTGMSTHFVSLHSDPRWPPFLEKVGLAS